MTGNWHVMGAGAQGLLLYAYAHKAQQQWTMIARDCPPDRRLHYQIDQQRESLPLRCTTLGACHNLKQVIVCVKATQIDAALAQLAPRLAHDAVVVLALNGVSWLALLDRYLPTQQILLLSSTHGSFRPQAWQVVDSGRDGKMLLGPGPRSPHDGAALARQWDGFGLHCSWHDNVVALLWRKAAINSCINPLTALLNCRNGELLSNVRASQWITRLIAEIATISAHTPWPLSAADLHALVAETCRVTALNYSSMQQDFRQHRETEIDAIVGAYIARAEQVNLPCPLLTQLRQAIVNGEDWSSTASAMGPV